MEATTTHTASLVQAPDALANVIRRLRWAWPIAILVGFPIGGYAANIIVGKIESVDAALLGGLIAGAIIASPVSASACSRRSCSPDAAPARSGGQPSIRGPGRWHGS